MNVDLHITERAAGRAGNAAINAGRADSVRVLPHIIKNPDRTTDQGYVAVLYRGMRPVGFA